MCAGVVAFCCYEGGCCSRVQLIISCSGLCISVCPCYQSCIVCVQTCVCVRAYVSTCVPVACTACRVFVYNDQLGQ